MLFMETGKDTHPQMNKTWSVLKQWFLENVRQLVSKLLQDWALVLLILGANLQCSNHLYTWQHTHNILHYKIICSINACL
jgi:hypothetical protein